MGIVWRESSKQKSSGSSTYSRFGVQLVLILLLITVIPLSAAATTNQPEYDSQDDAYLVSNLTELNWIREAPKEDYRLTNDINATPTKNWNSGKGWKPIGEQNYEFYGTLNGNGYTIHNLTINRSTETMVGFIAITGSDSVIKKLKIKSLSVKGGDTTGGLVGRSTGEISDIELNGTVTVDSGSSDVGGLVGTTDTDDHKYLSNIYAEVKINQTKGDGISYNVGGIVGGLGYDVGLTNSSAEGEINLSANKIGGLVGEQGYNSIKNSNSSVDVRGVSEVGGLVGEKGYGTIKNSYSTGSVKGDEEVGGLLGINSREDEMVINSYSTSKVTGNRSVGGLVGYNDGEVRSSYSTGNVTGATYVGGLVGWNVGTVESSFWNTQTSGLTESDGGVGKNTSELRDFWTFRSSPDVGGEYFESEEPVDETLKKGKVRNIALNAENNTFELVEVNESYEYGDEAVVKVNGVNKTVTESSNISVSGVEIGLSHVSDYSDPKEATLEFYVEKMWDISRIDSFEDVNQSYTWNIVQGESYPFLSWEEVEAGNYSVSIDVVNSSADPIPNASVQVDYSTKKTGTQGSVTFNDLYEADYTAIVDKPGYHRNSTNFRLLNDGQTETVVLEELKSEFNVSSLNLNSDQVEKGDSVTVNASIENIGSQKGRRIVEFKVDGQVLESQEVSLDPNEGEDLQYSFSKSKEGDYNVSVVVYEDSLSETVSVGPIEYNLTINSAEGGSTTPSSGSYTYEEGKALTVSADPNLGYRFSTWTGDVTKNSSEVTVTIDSDKNITPVFTGDRDLNITNLSVPNTEEGSIEFEFELLNNENESVTENLTVDFGGRNITRLRNEITLNSSESYKTAENGSTQVINLVDGDASEEATLSVEYGTVSDEESFRISSFERSFSEGFNYFSIPQVTDNGILISEVLDEDKIRSVWTYNNGSWKNYFSDAPQNQFNEFRGGQGYIVEADEDFTAYPVVETNISNIDSSSPVSPAQFEINSGWNLIGSYWTEPVQPNSSEAFSSMPDGEVTEVLYSENDGSLSLSTLGNSSMSAGEAYWVSAESGGNAFTKSY